MTPQTIGVVGAGSMGGGMVLLFAQKGNPVVFFDPSEEQASILLQAAKDSKSVDEKEVRKVNSLEELAKSMQPGHRVFVFSLPHGHVADKIIDQLEPFTTPGDLIIDCANEYWKNSQARSERCSRDSFGNGAVHYLGCGVSGGYQAARHGPSMSPGGTREAYNKAAPLLQKWAASYKGQPCVEYMGKGGSGHLVKTLHNGIEHGEMGVMCEVVALLHQGLELPYEEVAEILEKENNSGALRGNFLLDIGHRILRTKKIDGIDNPNGVLDDIEDKVVQDVNNTEGTGMWSTIEAAERHVAAPTLAVAHDQRLISANKRERVQISGLVRHSDPSSFRKSVEAPEFVRKVLSALYTSTLACFVQGLNVVARANAEDQRDIDMSHCIKIWRAGCIIRSETITDQLLPIYQEQPALNNLLLRPEISAQFQKGYQDLKDVVLQATAADFMVPCLSATLEYVKQVFSTKMPTNFQEAQMDFFGSHGYDVVGENRLDPVKGVHHHAWRPAAPTDSTDDA